MMYQSMRIAIVGRSPEDVEVLFAPYASEFTFVHEHPEMVVSYGGDGTLMESEFQFPGVPKIFLKNSRIAKLAQKKDNESIVAHLARGEYEIQERFKLSLTAKGEELVGLNDIIVHNADPRMAIRYNAFVDDKKINADEIIGDGVVISTPLGSTGYYRSITDSYFESGIGLAFNNSTEQADHIVLSELRTIAIHITRGPAQCYADNQKKVIELLEGDSVTVRRSDKVARLVVVH